MPAHHSRKSSGGAPQHHTQRRNSQSQATTPKPTHLRSNTAPEPPTLLRLPSAPAATARRPPASHSAHGIDNSRGPPVTLVTRSRSSQNPADFAYAQQQFLQSGLVSPSSSHHSSRRRGDDESVTSSEAPRPHSQQTNTRHPPIAAAIASAIPSPTLSRPPPARRSSNSTSRPPARRMASSTDGSSEYDSGPRSRMEDYQAAHSGRRAPAPASAPAPTPVTPGTDADKEDLFLNIAADTAPKQQRPSEATARVERLKSRVARVNSNRQSLPSALHSPSPVQSNSTATPTTSRIPVEPRSSALRRSSFLPTPSRAYERSSNSPAPDAAPRTRDLSHKASFTSTRRDAELSPRDFLAQFSATRRSSQPDVQHTPPSRTPVQPYRPSNLSHEPRTPHVENSYEAGSRADGTESHGSTGPAASVWDELDELKSRIRKIEMGGKIPSTSGAIVSQASQASAERPRTANTSATTVSSSPNQQRKSNLSPSESSVSTQAPPSTSRAHPLLRDALSKARQHVSPAVYRSLEATAQEALALAEMSGSGGPQGTLHSASSIINGSVVTDRQVRRKADNLCRSLTELCIAICDTKTGLSSPAFRSTQATISRRPSVQINGDSPTIRQSIEPESNTLNGVSPSRALSRIEARRTSMLVPDSNGSQRGNSQEPYDDRQTPSRIQRAGTSLHRTRQSVDEDEEDPIFRAPSRAMTSIDFRARQTDNNNNNNSNNRFSGGGRQYTSREPMPDLQPSPALQSSASLRRPSISSTPSNERSSLLFRDQSRYGHNLGREGSPVIYDKPMSGGLRARAQLSVARNPNNRHSVGGMSDIGRSVNLGRRLRGNSTGE